MTYDPATGAPDAELASRIVWFDACMTNVDRTARNTNMLRWHRRLWLIDHGSTMYFHHSPGWEADAQRGRAAFPAIRDHVLLRQARRVRDADAALAAAMTEPALAAIVDLIPDEWLREDGEPAAVRGAYLRYLTARVREPRPFVEEIAGGPAES